MSTADEGVREIQLNGKQLVFLFMAVTVVSVVIFLCGVLVGRGVQASIRPNPPALASSPDSGDDLPAAATPAATDGPTAPPTYTFPDALTSTTRPNEKLAPKKDPPPSVAAAPVKPGAAPAPPIPAASPVATAAPPPAKAPAAPAAPAADTTKPSPGIGSEPRGSGFAIQVAALNGRGEAEDIVRRLAGKGYAAYLMTPVAGQPPMFRVRVGKFKDRPEAEAVATRLEREEQFKPWITR